MIHSGFLNSWNQALPAALVNRKNLVILEDHYLPWEEPENKLRVIAA
ncbi:hypothetical protein [Congregibacter sp.]